MKSGLYLLLLTVILTSLTMIIGCSTKVRIEEMNAEEAFRYLRSVYDKSDYLSAVNGFDFYTLNYSGSSLVDSAQFMLGLSHFKLKEYLLAANVFEELYRRFPRSPLVPDAMYMIGDCYWRLSPKYSLDQEYTNKALDALQAFIDYFPEYTERVREAQDLIGACREKLAHKEYANGVIYLKMKDYGAAVIYFQSVVDMYYDTDWAPRAAYNLGISYAGNEMFEEADEAYRTFIAKYPYHPLRSKAESSLKNIHRKIEVMHRND